MRRCLGAFLCLSLIFVMGCATYAHKISGARNLFEMGQYDSAAAELKLLADKNDNDRLLYLLELGMVYHSAGKYLDAINAFKEAEKIAVLNDYTSVSQEVGSVILNDSTKVYKGEDFEKILINVYLAIDYTLLGQWEAALVECRRVNQKLDVMISQGKMPYQYNSFAKYLAAALFESQGEINDAFVDYRTVKKWMGNFAYLPGPLMRVADRLKANQELETYAKEYPAQKKYALPKDHGEVVLLLEQGRAPYKSPNPAFELIPQFLRNPSSYQSGSFRDSKKIASASPEILFDIEDTAIKELDEKMALITAKKIGGVVAKRAVAYGVGKATKSKDAELLSFLLLRLTDQADLRSWVTLPSNLRLARLALPAGRHDLVLDMVAYGGPREVKRWEKVQVKPGKITFLNYRVFE
ncbi:MAG: hypothetical protein EBR01_07300 [Proteobacteria bacterium]|jgi:uncharacterized protein|nr:hypothetical protein [Pseudomonadota bacterium]